MKKYLFISAALALAGCTSEDFLGGAFGSQGGSNEISFGTRTQNSTRAGEATGADAAQKLSNEFVVYGWKSGGFTQGANNGEAGTYADTKVDVFQNYVVKWVDMPGSTESNTKGWEYVGYTSKPIGGTGVEQSIKYWDYSAAEYDYLAWSVSGKATIEAINNDGVNPYKPHSLVFTAPTADDLSHVYVANQVTVKSDRTVVGTTDNTYGSNVLFTFRNMAAKVRVGIYETIPGYSVKDVAFYTATSTLGDGTSTLFATTGKPFATAGTVTAKFYDGTVGTENDVVVTTAASEVDSKAQFGALTNFADAEYKENAASYIGRASNQASLSTGTDNGWTYEFPMPATELNLKVDYTLVSKDGSGETIKVTGASAKVPANYGEWKANYAYTYLFKISDNTNGSTGNPGTNPVGLYPITFDACVVTVQDGNTQETITTVATPSITTYQNGSDVTAQSEYSVITGKDIFVTVENVDLVATGASPNCKLYTAIDLGKDYEGITEETVANWANNDIVLTDVSDILTGGIETIPAEQTIDNVAITLTKKAAQFTPVANQIYVFEYNDGTTKHYKVIRMVGANNTATYALSIVSPALSIIAEGSSTTVTVKNGGNNVLGAKNYFKGADDFNVTDNGNGTYTFTAKAGIATGNKTVSLTDGSNATSNGLAITVNAYEFATATGNVSEGGTGYIILNLGGSAAADVDVATNFEILGTTGVTISSVADGRVNLTAGIGAEDGKIVFKNGTDVVAEANIHVKKYSVALKAGEKAIINGTGAKTTLVLHFDGAPVGTSMISSNTSIATVGSTDATTGELEVTNAGVGTATISRGSASIDIECTNFAVTLYTDEACTSAVGAGDLSVATGTYYAKFTNNGTAENVTGLQAQSCSLAKKSDTGVYKVTVSATGTATIKYTYKGVTFTLATKTVGA